MAQEETSNAIETINKIENFLNIQKTLYGNTIIKNETEMKKTKSAKWAEATTLEELYSKINKCQKCSLGETRINFVFGTGNKNADIMLIGEAPGADEDEQGIPFVGRAGQLLTKILEAVNIKRDDVYICNILKCRPPQNRAPLPEEMETCEPYLKKQIELVKPKLILCLGRVSAHALLQSKESLTDLREKTHYYQNIPTIVTYHPAALLRNPNWKIPTWEDVKNFKKLYESLSKK